MSRRRRDGTYFPGRDRENRVQIPFELSLRRVRSTFETTDRNTVFGGGSKVLTLPSAPSRPPLDTTSRYSIDVIPCLRRQLPADYSTTAIARITNIYRRFQ